MFSRNEMLLRRMENAVIRRLRQQVRRLEAKCRELEKTQKSPHDAKTGALTSERFEELADRVIHGRHRRASEKKEPVALVMIDIDFLKPVNDTYGHAAGDEVLRVFSELTQGHLKREGDLVCRRGSGADEFLLLLCGANEMDVPEIVEKLRKKFEKTAFTFHDGTKKSARLHPSFSYGTAMCKGNKDTLSEMFARADREMYAEKKARKSSR